MLFVDINCNLCEFDSFIANIQMNQLYNVDSDMLSVLNLKVVALMVATDQGLWSVMGPSAD